MAVHTSSGFLTGIDERNADGTLKHVELALDGYEPEETGRYRLVCRHLLTVQGVYTNQTSEQIRFRPRITGSAFANTYDPSWSTTINTQESTVTLDPAGMAIIDMTYESGMNAVPSVRPGGVHVIEAGAQGEAGFVRLEGVPTYHTARATDNILVFEELLPVPEEERDSEAVGRFLHAIFCGGSRVQSPPRCWCRGVDSSYAR